MLGLATFWVAGCGAAAPTPAVVRASVGPSPATRSGASPAPSATALPRVSLADCRSPQDRAALHLVHRFAVSPDDIAVAADGSLWVSARQANQMISLRADGAAATAQRVDGGPEGVAAGDAVYVALQNRNSVVVLGPTPRTIVALPNRTANAGIDGIALDAARNRLLVPDSPTGELYAVPLGGGAPLLLAAGLGRPVAATTLGADVVVASESAAGLTVVEPSGASRRLGVLSGLDEVVAYRGLLYVTGLDGRDVVAVDPASGASRTVAINLAEPQGLAVTADGMLLIVDTSTRSLFALPTCGR